MWIWQDVCGHEQDDHVSGFLVGEINLAKLKMFFSYSIFLYL
jgi:hypothetical protein